MKPHTGQCLCGSVKYTLPGELSGVISCHCKDCQRLHGIYNPMVVVPRNDLILTEEKGLAWYPSSEESERGFCKKCGSALFMRTEARALVSAGSLDDPTGLKNLKNIFTDDAGEYYDLPAEA
ncbi:MAG: GFA family protein [bacterium]